MSAGCCHNVGDIGGLVSGHAYSLLGVEKIKDKSGIVDTLAKMRNPWGSEMYTGKWSDSDPNWTSGFK